MTIERPTIEQYVEHLKQGVSACLVCGIYPVTGGWTDYNGQIRCSTCGMTYQILGSHLKDEFLAEHHLTKEEIAQRYCDAFMEWPLCRAYWENTGRPIPFGTYFGSSPISTDDREAFYRWIWNHRAELKPQYEDAFKWNVIEEKFA